MIQDFYQIGPELKNQFSSDSLLQDTMARLLPPDLVQEIALDLARFGERAATDIYQHSLEAERQEPELVSYDPWGRRIDQIKVSPSWDKLKDISAEEGLIAIGYERKQKEFSRLYQFAKLYLFHSSSAFFSCPLAMTDGAARAIELYGDKNLKERAFKNLTSRDPRKFWTSGQWMTERTGGSDVSESATIAKKTASDKYHLFGTKSFTSATTSEMAMTLARIEGDQNPGSRGLSLFYLELRDQKANLQNIKVNRLKDKLGTRALPTAELDLVGTPAVLVGGEGGGVKKISSLFNITRMYNAICSLSATRRALVLALDYAKKRKAFSASIIEHALHRETLAECITEFEGSFVLTFELIRLLGREECGLATEEDKAILRLLTPIAKLYTAKVAVAVTSEVVECFGGAGYIEDVGIAKYLRDAQVFSIWEGTTNVLSLDVLRAIEKENALMPFMIDMKKRIAGLLSISELQKPIASIQDSLSKLEAYLRTAMTQDRDYTLASSRAFSYTLARIYTACLLAEKAAIEKKPRSFYLLNRWCEKGLFLLKSLEKAERELTKQFLDSF
ncbi:MAG: acyl-CoA dehydrogenase family protein [Oligoflexia bacterium]|nr:acyl-CoA dehydrogenase family protein [Oligoflexia bacterium]